MMRDLLENDDWMASIDLKDAVSISGNLGRAGSYQAETGSSWNFRRNFTQLLQVLGKAGVDTSVFKAHSVRGASSTPASEKVEAIEDDILHTADWNTDSTFQRFYFCPTQRSGCASSKTSITLYSSTALIIVYCLAFVPFIIGPSAICIGLGPFIVGLCASDIIAMIIMQHSHYAFTRNGLVASVLFDAL